MLLAPVHRRRILSGLRLLPMRPPFPQIAGELLLSLDTIKPQPNSVYRKLGASSRSQAVTQSRELGLLDG